MLKKLMSGIYALRIYLLFNATAITVIRKILRLLFGISRIDVVFDNCMRCILYKNNKIAYHMLTHKCRDGKTAYIKILDEYPSWREKRVQTSYYENGNIEQTEVPIDPYNPWDFRTKEAVLGFNKDGSRNYVCLRGMRSPENILRVARVPLKSPKVRLTTT